jgi:hypothetical protein
LILCFENQKGEINMTDLMNIHKPAQEEIKKHFSLKSVKLKHPIPYRPILTLVLIKKNGEVTALPD